MTTQTDYTAEQWQTLITAPTMAGLLVTLGDMSGPIGLVQEASALFEVTTETGAESTSSVIRAVAQAVKDRKKLEMPELPKDGDAARVALLDGVRRAGEIVGQKAPAEVDAYKSWLMTIARRTAEAAKEGGFLGFGGTRVSEGEQAALDDLGAALGVSAT